MVPAFLVTNGNTRFVPLWDDGLKEATDVRWAGERGRQGQENERRVLSDSGIGL